MRANANPKRVADCEAAVAQARKAGQATMSVGGADITLDQAANICAEAALYTAALKDYALFAEIPQRMNLLSPDLMPSDEFVQLEVQRAADCMKAVDVMLAANVPSTLPYVVKDQDGTPMTKTVADLRPNLCDALKKATAQYTKDAAEVAAKARAKFTKFGIKDDKLDLMLKYDGSVFLPGGRSSGDMKKYAAASALFVWLTSDPDAHDVVVHTVRRYKFKDNKLVSQTEKTYRKKRTAKLGAAPFR